MSSSEMIRPMTPTISRMVPIVWIDTPETVAVTAHLRMAPTAIRTMDVPIPMPQRLPGGPQYHALHGRIGDGDGGHLRPARRAQGLSGHHPADRRAARRAACRRDR